MTQEERAQALARSIFVEPTEEEKLYFGMVDRAVDSMDPRIISNGRAGHAVYLLWKFMGMAQRRVNICTGELKRTFDGVKAYAEPKLVESAIEFLRRGGELGIVILDEPDLDANQTIHDHPFVAALSSTDIGRGKVTVGRFQMELPEPIFHYIVVDGRTVRAEVNPKQAEAYAKLSDPKTGSALDSLFEVQMQRSEPLFSLPAA